MFITRKESLSQNIVDCLYGLIWSKIHKTGGEIHQHWLKQVQNLSQILRVEGPVLLDTNTTKIIINWTVQTDSIECIQNSQYLQWRLEQTRISTTFQYKYFQYKYLRKVCVENVIIVE